MKKNVKTGQLDILDDVFFVVERSNPSDRPAADEGDETPYVDSQYDDSIEEIGSDGEVRIRRDKHPRYKKREGVLVFELGMKFNGKKQFKKAMTRYVLAEKKVVNFMKDDHKRVRVTCD